VTERKEEKGRGFGDDSGGNSEKGRPVENSLSLNVLRLGTLSQRKTGGASWTRGKTKRNRVEILLGEKGHR